MANLILSLLKMKTDCKMYNYCKRNHIALKLNSFSRHSKIYAPNMLCYSAFQLHFQNSRLCVLKHDASN